MLVRMRFGLVWSVVLGAGCYSPSYKDCEVTCATGNGCPSGLTCDQTLGVCRTEGHGQACGAPVDDTAMAPDSNQACWPYAPTNYAPCEPDFPPAVDYTYGSGQIDTDAGTFQGPPGTPLMQIGSIYLSGGTRVRLLHVTSFSLPSASTTLFVRGDLPLLVVSEGNIDINGQIDATGAVKTPGAGCSAGLGEGHANPGSTGGGGGGFLSGGGLGGAAGTGTSGGVGGAVIGTAMQRPLVAGCPGAAGGTPSATGAPAGAGGFGGGAVELAARGTITINGRIVAGGAGGAIGMYSNPITQCPNGCATGGGGGGAGGAIVLEATSVTFAPNATACATGGGGGQGAANDPTQQGKPGNPGTCVGGGGGNGNNIGGSGGDGSISQTDASPGKAPAAGASGAGGGGGGGAGRIRIHASNITASPSQIVPAATP